MKTFLIISALYSILSASEYSIIISKKISVTETSSQQIRDIYLMKRHTIGNQKIIPLNLLGQEASRIAFENEILKMDRNRLNTYWVKQHFQGITPPITQPSHESIKAFVQNVEGAIGYIPSSQVDSNVKVIYEF
jgi:ABC-type phosphate transport system substrate-binding protein